MQIIINGILKVIKRVNKLIINECNTAYFYSESAFMYSCVLNKTSEKN